CIDVETIGREATVEQRHGNRVWLLARGASRAQYPEQPRRMGSAPSPIDDAPQRGKGLAVAEEPGLRDHDSLNEALLLVPGGAEVYPIGVRVGEAERSHSLADCALDRGRADRCRIEAHLRFEQSGDGRQHQSMPKCAHSCVNASYTRVVSSCSSSSRCTSTPPRQAT